MAKKDHVTAAEIAREMKLSPKRVRAVLRAAGYVREGTRWHFPAGDKGLIKKLVRDSRKRATIDRTPTVHVFGDGVSADEATA